MVSVNNIIVDIEHQLQQTTGRYQPTDRNQLGLGTPIIRQTGKKYRKEIRDIEEARVLAIELFKLQEYEYSIIAVVIYSKFIKKFTQQDEETLLQIAHQYVNDWAVADVFSLELLGPYVVAFNKETLQQVLASGEKNWARRCALASWVYLVRKGIDSQHAKTYAQKLLKDPDRLVRKAADWLLREINKKSI